MQESDSYTFITDIPQYQCQNWITLADREGGRNQGGLPPGRGVSAGPHTGAGPTKVWQHCGRHCGRLSYWAGRRVDWAHNTQHQPPANIHNSSIYITVLHSQYTNCGWAGVVLENINQYQWLGVIRPSKLNHHHHPAKLMLITFPLFVGKTHT